MTCRGRDGSSFGCVESGLEKFLCLFFVSLFQSTEVALKWLNSWKITQNSHRCLLKVSVTHLENVHKQRFPPPLCQLPCISPHSFSFCSVPSQFPTSGGRGSTGGGAPMSLSAAPTRDSAISGSTSWASSCHYSVSLLYERLEDSRWCEPIAPPLQSLYWAL